jgi:hypothetical protein
LDAKELFEGPAGMSNEIYDILQKLTLIEGNITPTGVKKGLNQQQKSAPQLPALFKPASIKALGNKTDPKHPASKYFVGAESVDLSEEQDIDEDVLSKVKKTLGDYLKNIEDEIGQKEKPDTSFKNKKQETDEVAIDPPTASFPVKTIALEDGRVCEIHGDTSRGFEVRHNGKSLPSRFNDIDHAVMAVDMYAAKRKNNNNNDQQSDYMEEK